MNIVLGFGSNEQAFEKQEVEFVEEFVRKEMPKYDSMFRNEMVDDLRSQLEARSSEYRKLSDSYKEATEYPDRYGYYYFDVVHNVNTLCVVFKFSHINRRHAMSPDGWGMMQNRQVISFDSVDYI